jgi:hypothetical protein
VTGAKTSEKLIWNTTANMSNNRKLVLYDLGRRNSIKLEQGMVWNTNTIWLGIFFSSINDRNVVMVLQVFIQSPNKPVRQSFRETGVCKTAVLMNFVA